jgi:hypothetical protein
VRCASVAATFNPYNSVGAYAEELVRIRALLDCNAPFAFLRCGHAHGVAGPCPYHPSGPTAARVDAVNLLIIHSPHSRPSKSLRGGSTPRSASNQPPRCRLNPRLVGATSAAFVRIRLGKLLCRD